MSAFAPVQLAVQRPQLGSLAVSQLLTRRWLGQLVAKWVGC